MVVYVIDTLPHICYTHHVYSRTGTYGHNWVLNFAGVLCGRRKVGGRFGAANGRECMRFSIDLSMHFGMNSMHSVEECTHPPQPRNY